jgi:hypothetical protein
MDEQQTRRKKKKNIEDIVDDTAVDNIFAGFNRRIKKAEKQYEDIPSGMKKDPKNRAEIQAKLANKALKDKKPFQEFKDTRREVLGTQRYGKGGKVKKKKSSRKALRGGGCEIR